METSRTPPYGLMYARMVSAGRFSTCHIHYTAPGHVLYIYNIP